MPVGQKGTGKKGRDVRQSRSRNTTPSLVGARTSLPPTDSGETAYLELPIQQFRASDDVVVENYSASIPNSKDLEGLLERLQKLIDVVDTRGQVCDRGMRLLAQARKDRTEEIENERRDEERKERSKRDAAEEEERSKAKANKKERKDKRPLTHGAHGLAPQDGSNLDSSPIRDPTNRKAARKMSRDIDSASSSLSPVAVATPAGGDIDEKEGGEDDDSSSDERQPAPAPAIPHLQVFGEDPSTYPDPTIYEIRAILSNMTDDEKREIYSVAVFPKDNLENLIPGSPPDKDFSNPKPNSQVQATTFATYIEPYFRPFTEEDLAFLRERGDRIGPFRVPRRGKRHYTDIWAEEDGGMALDTPQHGRDKLAPNQARGTIEDLDDSTAETEELSVGPLLSRLLSTMRPERRAPASEDKPAANGATNGEASINGESNADLDNLLDLGPSNEPAPIPPATFMTESNSESYKKGVPYKLDAPQVDERIKQELRHLGFLAPDAVPDFDAHEDDEIAARIRFLQTKLKETTIMNGARKARLTDLVKERMAHQEYTTILEDLDGQVQTAYLKRTRTMGKNKKNKRPGGAGGGSHFVGPGGSGMARPGIGDLTKTLMERRRKWIDSIGMVFDEQKPPRSTDPDSYIFKPEMMADFIRKEREAADDEGEED
ncbi:Chromatin-remodeling complexes subunit NGG1 [Hyphodiscus hymeniophilus]|uniref:Chromatin-remodeling complexes subunit NGG1 n=1 Tax=Hyphodiscus hymeniophilus TaxID=353542 RepID=A0A9P6VPV8_9HELO|nr:Chromatin-remodeling complexes subunit NGG1 [Hyphodiscus hymeniophilus]